MSFRAGRRSYGQDMPGQLTHADPLATDLVAIRRATEADAPALARLAARDGSPARSGEVLIAHVGGVPRAAIEVESDATIADPFRPTAHLVDLLRIRAARRREADDAPPWTRATM